MLLEDLLQEKATMSRIVKPILGEDCTQEIRIGNLLKENKHEEEKNDVRG